MPEITLLLGLGLLAAFAGLGWRRLRWRRRRQRLQDMLDLCDSLEHLLDQSQRRMQELQAVVGRVPADMAAVANAALETGLPVREAKRDVLQHRLWIQKQGENASLDELDTAKAALSRAHARLSDQFAALDAAGTDLATATAASEEAAKREPAALRRPSAP